MKHLPIAVLLALLPITTSACGFIFSHAPPEGHGQMESFTCTEANAGPIIDVIWGSLNVLGALAAAADPAAYENSDQIISVGLLWGGLSAAAAGVGFDKSKKCKAAKRALAERQMSRQGIRRELADAIVQAVTINPTADTLTVGERVQFSATAVNSSGSVISNKPFVWSSSNDAIASVNSAGLVTAHATGSVVIAANTDNVVGTANLLVVSSGRK